MFYRRKHIRLKACCHTINRCFSTNIVNMPRSVLGHLCRAMVGLRQGSATGAAVVSLWVLFDSGTVTAITRFSRLFFALGSLAHSQFGGDDAGGNCDYGIAN
jgi:hypothetical protein